MSRKKVTKSHMQLPLHATALVSVFSISVCSLFIYLHGYTYTSGNAWDHTLTWGASQGQNSNSPKISLLFYSVIPLSKKEAHLTTMHKDHKPTCRLHIIKLLFFYFFTFLILFHFTCLQVLLLSMWAFESIGLAHLASLSLLVDCSILLPKINLIRM